MKIKSVALMLVGAFILVSCQSTIDYSYQKTGTPIVSKNIDSPFFGDPSAKVQMMIFADFQCPACIYFEKNIGLKILSDYALNNKIGLTYKNYPLSFHKNAMDDAAASLCVLEQGKYQDFALKMYTFEEKQNGLRTTKEDRQNITKAIGIDMTRFDKCMDDGNYVNKIKEDMAEGDKLGLTGTPAVYVNGKNLEFKNSEDFFKILDQLIK